MKEFFKVKASKYDQTKNYEVVRPASLNFPKDNAVLFVTKAYIKQWKILLGIKECIVIWPEDVAVPGELQSRHAIIKSKNPRQGLGMFYRENKISYNVMPCDYEMINGAFIGKGARIGRNTIIFPGAYIDCDVSIGNNCYIATGARIIGSVQIGDNVIIKENAVIGGDVISRMRDENGKVAMIPQFGGVIIEDDVLIEAATVVARGAIDNTIIHRGCKIDNSCYISHNVELGEDTVIVGETIMFGSSSTGKQTYISGNSTVRDGTHIGDHCFVGMNSNVVCDIPDDAVVAGNPARMITVKDRDSI